MAFRFNACNRIALCIFSFLKLFQERDIKTPYSPKLIIQHFLSSFCGSSSVLHAFLLFFSWLAPYTVKLEVYCHACSQVVLDLAADLSPEHLNRVIECSLSAGLSETLKTPSFRNQLTAVLNQLADESSAQVLYLSAAVIWHEYV